MFAIARSDVVVDVISDSVFEFESDDFVEEILDSSSDSAIDTVVVIVSSHFVVEISGTADDVGIDVGVFTDVVDETGISAVCLLDISVGAFVADVVSEVTLSD